MAKRRDKCLLLFALPIALCLSHKAWAQTAIVTRNVNLRSDPSPANPPQVPLTPNIVLILLEPDSQRGYLHARTYVGTEAWVWSRNVHPITEIEVSMQGE